MAGSAMAAVFVGTNWGLSFAVPAAITLVYCVVTALLIVPGPSSVNLKNPNMSKVFCNFVSLVLSLDQIVMNFLWPQEYDVSNDESPQIVEMLWLFLDTLAWTFIAIIIHISHLLL